MSERSGLSLSVNWRVTEVKYPAVIWQRYADVLGRDVMKKVYGDHWPPPDKRPLEQVFAIRNPDIYQRPFDPLDHPAAWMSLSYDQFDQTNVYMSRGVWPAEHGQGLGRFMRGWAEDFCRSHEANSLTIWVGQANQEHLDNVKADAYWKASAFAFDPPAWQFVHYIE